MQSSSSMASKLLLPSVPLHIHPTTNDDVLYCLSEGLYRRGAASLDTSMDMFEEDENDIRKDNECSQVYKYKSLAMVFASSNDLLFSLHTKKSSMMFVECVDAKKLVCINPCVLKIDLNQENASIDKKVFTRKSLMIVLDVEQVSKVILNEIGGKKCDKASCILFVCLQDTNVHAVALRSTLSDSVEAIGDAVVIAMEGIETQAHLVQSVLKERRPRSKNQLMQQLLRKTINKHSRKTKVWKEDMDSQSSLSSGLDYSFVRIHHEMIASNLILGLTTDGRIVHCDFAEQPVCTPLTLGCVCVSAVNAKRRICYAITTAMFVYEIDLQTMEKGGQIRIQDELITSLRPESVSSAINVITRKVSKVNMEREELQVIQGQIELMEKITEAKKQDCFFFDMRPSVVVNNQGRYNLEVSVRLKNLGEDSNITLANSKRGQYSFVIGVQSKCKNDLNEGSKTHYTTLLLPSSMSREDSLTLFLSGLDQSLLNSPSKLPLRITLDLELRVDDESYARPCFGVGKEEEVTLIDFFAVEGSLEKGTNKSRSRVQMTKDKSWEAFLYHISKERLGLARSVIKNGSEEKQVKSHEPLETDNGLNSISVVLEPKMISYASETKRNSFFSTLQRLSESSENNSNDNALQIALFESRIQLHTHMNDQGCLHLSFFGKDIEELIALKRDLLRVKRAFWKEHCSSTIPKKLIRETHLLREEVLLMEQDDTVESAAKLKELHRDVRAKVALALL